MSLEADSLLSVGLFAVVYTNHKWLMLVLTCWWRSAWWTKGLICALEGDDRSSVNKD